MVLASLIRPLEHNKYYHDWECGRSCTFVRVTLRVFKAFQLRSKVPPGPPGLLVIRKQADSDKAAKANGEQWP